MSFPETRVGDGNVAVRLINKTGAASIKGTLVQAAVGSTTLDYSFEVTGVDDYQPIGVVIEDGIADGEWCWVAIAGLVDVLLKDATAATMGYWAHTADAAGRADITLIAPPGGGIPELETHMREIGHCIETKAAGKSVLAKIIMHFN